jgi:hypothetical protein
MTRNIARVFLFRLGIVMMITVDRPYRSLFVSRGSFCALRGASGRAPGGMVWLVVWLLLGPGK